MKTLDEVIKALEYCLNPVDNFGNCNAECPYIHCCDPSNHDVTEDALHYLQTYQRIEDEYEELKDWWAEEYVTNEPLSWEQLKQMEGKPVWVDHKYYKKWLIVKEVYEETIVLDGNGFYTQYFSDDNEKETRWQAYRKERE